jgi:hypothetical protein
MEKWGMPGKPETYFLTSATRQRATGSAFGYPTVVAALRAADVILAKDAELIWIEDREGNLVLPADQVRLRASSPRSAPGAR